MPMTMTEQSLLETSSGYIRDADAINYRVGIFSISSKFFYENPEVMCRAFSMLQFAPIESSSDTWTNELKFRGLSPFFDEVPQGSLIKEYIVTIEKRVLNNTMNTMFAVQVQVNGKYITTAMCDNKDEGE